MTQDNGLPTNREEMTELIQTIKKDMKNELTKKRFYHTIGVAYTASSMAMRYGEDLNKALIAGLLHDSQKCITDEEKLKKCAEYGLPVSDYERENPYLLHGKLGAHLAQERYGIYDEDLYRAIWYHTTGTKEMTTFMKIIFLADYIEPGRKPLEHLDEIRRQAFLDIDQSMYLTLQNMMNYLGGEEDEMDENTIIAYHYYDALVNRS